MTNDLVEKLRALHVWPQVVADDHADLLTPRRIDKLYEVGRVSHEAADLIEAQAREIKRLREAVAGLMKIAEMAMPDTYFATDSRVNAARAALGGSHDQ